MTPMLHILRVQEDLWLSALVQRKGFSDVPAQMELAAYGCMTDVPCYTSQGPAFIDQQSQQHPAVSHVKASRCRSVWCDTVVVQWYGVVCLPVEGTAGEAPDALPRT